MERIEDKLNADWVLNPTPIAIRFKSEFISTALRDTTAQMGLPVGGRKGEDYQINVDTDPLPYWRAWKQFRAAAKLKEFDWAVSAAKLRRIDGGVMDIQFIKQNEEPDVMLGRTLRFGTPPIAFDAGPVAAYAEDDRSSVRVRVKWHALEKSAAVFAVELRPEPRLEIVTVPRVEITKIVDADGKELPVASRAVVRAAG